jgi:hypothetical protein
MILTRVGSTDRDEACVSKTDYYLAATRKGIEKHQNRWKHIQYVCGTRFIIDAIETEKSNHAMILLQFPFSNKIFANIYKVSEVKVPFK